MDAVKAAQIQADMTFLIDNLDSAIIHAKQLEIAQYHLDFYRFHEVEDRKEGHSVRAVCATGLLVLETVAFDETKLMALSQGFPYGVTKALRYLSEQGYCVEKYPMWLPEMTVSYTVGEMLIFANDGDPARRILPHTFAEISALLKDMRTHATDVLPELTLDEMKLTVVR